MVFLADRHFICVSVPLKEASGRKKQDFQVPVRVDTHFFLNAMQGRYSRFPANVLELLIPVSSRTQDVAEFVIFRLQLALHEYKHQNTIHLGLSPRLHPLE